MIQEIACSTMEEPLKGISREIPAERAPAGPPIKPGTFAHTSPYGGCWLQHFYSRYCEDLYGGKVVRETDFLEKLLTTRELPEMMIMGNFIVDRFCILSICRELGINAVHSEDGFFPHYETMHADPIGFCWESSLTRMLYRGCTERQRSAARAARQRWLTYRDEELPACVSPPYIFWPLQLLADRVNRWDLNVSEWNPLLRHFRQCTPEEIQLVIKEHPRGRPQDTRGLEETAASLPNTVIVPTDTDVRSLVARSSAVAGANSTVLYEARLMFHKPTYVYARGWFTNHYDLFFPMARSFEARTLNFIQYVEDNRRMRCGWLDDYTDWFLSQLLARQIGRDLAEHDGDAFCAAVRRLSFQSYQKYGEEIFQAPPTDRRPHQRP